MVDEMREMKDSGASFIGMVPANWRVDKIKYHLERHEFRNPGDQQILSVYREYGVIPKDSRDDNHNVTSDDTSKYKYVVPGFFVINKMKAWQGSMGVSEHEGVVSPAYYIYRFRNGMYVHKYFHYLLRGCYKDEFRRLSGGIREGQWDLPAYSFENTVVLLPEIKEQKQIVNFLDSRCAEIDSLSVDIQSEIETLEAYKKSKVFDVVEHGIDHTDYVQTDSDVWKTIPSGWKLVDIKYIFEIVKRIAGKEGYDIIAITQQGLKYKDISSNEGQIASDYSGYQFVYPGDFAMNHMDLLTGWVDLSDKFGVTSPDYRVFRLREPERYDRKYYKYIMQCCYMCRIFYSLGQGVSNLGRWRLQTSSFNNFKVPVPPYEEQVKIGEYLDNEIIHINSIIVQKQEQLSVLADYKKSIIYEYVTGKKEVPVA